MSFLIGMQVLGTALSVSSAISKGNAKNTMAQMNAQQETVRLAQEKIIAMQRHNDRLAEFDTSRKTNEAHFAFLGRDSSDASFKAFQKANLETVNVDLKRSNFQSLLEQSQIRYSRDQQLFSGREALRQSKVEVANSLLTGLNNYSKTRTS